MRGCNNTDHVQAEHAGEWCKDCLREWLDASGATFFYVQDTRGYVGNSMLWWAVEHKGYVCDIRKAHFWLKSEVKAVIHRDTDIPWPARYIDDRVSHHIDMQTCCREDIEDA